MMFSEIASKALIVILPYFLKNMLDIMAGNNPATIFSNAAFIHVLWMFFGLVIFIECAKRTSGIIDYFLSPAMVALVRGEMYGYVQKHSHGFFMDRFAGSIGNKMTQTSSAIRDICYIIFRDFIPLICGFAFTAFISINIDKNFSIMFVAWFVIYSSFCILMSPRIAGYSHIYADARSRFTGRVIDALTNNVSIRAHAAHEQEFGIIRESAENLKHRAYDIIRIIEITRAVQSIMTITLFFAVIGYALKSWSDGTMELTVLAYLLPVTVSLVALSNEVSERLIHFFEHFGTVMEGVEFMAHPYDVDDAPDAKPLRVKRGEIAFKNLRFFYPSRAQKNNVFQNLDFTVAAGQKVGLVGPSGAGKTSLVALLLRFYDPEAGGIFIDGQNIRAVTQESLRKNISYIPQDTSLFHRSLFDNIAYGVKNPSKKSVIAAAKKANAHEFIMQLPQGYDTIVGERGLKLSGGQRQRIAIARAILKNAPILVLDEATSALDSESEKLIQDSLKTLMKGKTVIAIAHRLSTIAHLDRLLVLENGKIIEDGTHKTLTAKRKGLYKKLWSMQSGGFLAE